MKTPKLALPRCMVLREDYVLLASNDSRYVPENAVNTKLEELEPNMWFVITKEMIDLYLQEEAISATVDQWLSEVSLEDAADLYTAALDMGPDDIILTVYANDDGWDTAACMLMDVLSLHLSSTGNNTGARLLQSLSGGTMTFAPPKKTPAKSASHKKPAYYGWAPPIRKGGSK